MSGFINEAPQILSILIDIPSWACFFDDDDDDDDDELFMWYGWPTKGV